MSVRCPSLVLFFVSILVLALSMDVQAYSFQSFPSRSSSLGQYRKYKSGGTSQCQAACNSDKRCLQFEYNSKNKYCYLKAGYGSFVSNGKTTAGRKVVSTSGVFGTFSNMTTSAAYYKREGGNIGTDNCARLCALDSSCKMYVFNTESKYCYFFSAAHGLYAKNGRYAGRKSSALTCPAGHYVVNDAQTICKKCPAGKYQPTSGNQKSCKSCPGDKFSVEGATSCVSECPNGYAHGANQVCLLIPTKSFKKDLYTSFQVCDKILGHKVCIGPKVKIGVGVSAKIGLITYKNAKTGEVGGTVDGKYKVTYNFFGRKVTSGISCQFANKGKIDWGYNFGVNFSTPAIPAFDTTDIIVAIVARGVGSAAGKKMAVAARRNEMDVAMAGFAGSATGAEFGKLVSAGCTLHPNQDLFKGIDSINLFQAGIRLALVVDQWQFNGTKASARVRFSAYVSGKIGPGKVKVLGKKYKLPGKTFNTKLGDIFSDRVSN